MPEELKFTGWDRDSAKRTLMRSMRVLESCIKETEHFMTDWLHELRDEMLYSMDNLHSLVRELEEMLEKNPKNFLKAHFEEIRKLARMVELQNRVLCGNPKEMVSLANQLATLNNKTMTMQLSIERAYGDLSDKPKSDVFEELTGDQVMKVYQWVEENRLLKEALGEN